jgi:hypothetical protein
VDGGGVTGGTLAAFLTALLTLSPPALMLLPARFCQVAGCFGVAEPDCIDQPDQSAEIRFGLALGCGNWVGGLLEGAEI